MWWPGVTMTGRVQHEGRIYSIRRMRGGMRALAVVAMSEDRMPQEHAPMSHMRAKDLSLHNDPLVQQGDASMLRPKTYADKKSRPKTGPPDYPPRRRPRTLSSIIIVAYTKKAASSYADVSTRACRPLDRRGEPVVPHQQSRPHQTEAGARLSDRLCGGGRTR